MIAYKGFNKDLACTLGKGVYQYEVGKVYKEEEAKCANSGFHCVEEPIEVLTWYKGSGSRYCVVDARGDINEDGDERISCTEMEILREISLVELGMYECVWLLEHPERKMSKQVKTECGKATEGIIVVRGKQPKAAGKIGCTMFLAKEKRNSKQIEEVGVVAVDGKNYKEGQYYNVRRRRVCEKKT